MTDPAGSGMVGLGHYLDLSPSDLAPFQNAHVMIDIALGVAILAYALRLSLRAPYPDADVGVEL